MVNLFLLNMYLTLFVNNPYSFVDGKHTEKQNTAISLQKKNTYGVPFNLRFKQFIWRGTMIMFILTLSIRTVMQ